MTNHYKNMSKLEDLTGRRFGRLVVLERGAKAGRVKWNCRCDCGARKDVAANHLKSAVITSCGCLSSEVTTERNITHGMCKTPEWFAYWAAKRRCSSTNEEKRHNYYDRGIQFKFESFEKFFEELGPKPEGMWLDRQDNNGNYEPGNVRWATPQIQRINQRPKHVWEAEKAEILKSRLTSY